ncbi:MAG: hypothetical protein J6S71_03040 [Clostridia bacterium]|nr:hypothetical protein [Clostridia bacterium]
MKFTQIPATTFQELQLNAGILLSAFDPSSGEAEREDILGATSGGVSFTDTPEYSDFGEDIDNCPKNTKELKKIISREIAISGTYLTVNTTHAKSLIAAASIDEDDPTHIVPRDALEDTDFEDIWWVGDYSDKNGETNGGYIAIHLKNALSTGGFSLKSGDKAKGQFAFTYTAHYSIEDPDTVPYDLYIKAGGA